MKLKEDEFGIYIFVRFGKGRKLERINMGRIHYGRIRSQPGHTMGFVDFNLNLERFDFKVNFGSRAWGNERG